MRFILGVFFLCCLPLSSMAEQSYSIEQMKGNLYRFSAGPYHSVFYVTKAGILVADPLSKDAATWLSGELKKRFNVPVRYMVYSHNHVDHVTGGEVFAKQGATVIAHTLAKQDLVWTKANTAIPDMSFNDSMEISLGEAKIQLQYHGANNGRGSISMRFLPENALFVVDWIVLGRMPYKNLLGYDIHGMISSTREILQGPGFDLLIGGHADAGTRKDVEQYLGYLEALYAAVRDGMMEGKKLEQLQQEIRLPKYKNLRMYDEWLADNIEGVYNTLVSTSYFNFRTDLPGNF